jgi:hypothetical protein
VYVTFDEPVYARVIRILPQAWNNGIMMRFEAIYIDDNNILPKAEEKPVSTANDEEKQEQKNKGPKVESSGVKA